MFAWPAWQGSLETRFSVNRFPVLSWSDGDDDRYFGEARAGFHAGRVDGRQRAREIRDAKWCLSACDCP